MTEPTNQELSNQISAVTENVTALTKDVTTLTGTVTALTGQISELSSQISGVLGALIDFKDAVIQEFGKVRAEIKEGDAQTRELIVDFRQEMSGAMEILMKKQDDQDSTITDHDRSIEMIKSDIVVIKTKVFAD